MRLFFFTLVLVLVSTCTAFGMDDHVITQWEMNEDAKKECDKANKELNTLYGQILESLDNAETKEKLIHAEKVWMEYRDAHGDGAAQLYKGGSISNMIKFNALGAVTYGRIEALKSAYQNKLEVNENAKKEYDKANEELNTLYGQILELMHTKLMHIDGNAETKEFAKEYLGECREKLMHAEKVWMEYRDAHGDAVSQLYQGGTMSDLVKYAAMKEITEQRIQDLKVDYLETMKLWRKN